MSSKSLAALVVDMALAAAALLIDGLGSTDLTTAAGRPLPMVYVLVPVVFGSVTLLLRRRLPWLVYGVWWLIGLLPAVVIGVEPFAGVLIALATVCGRSRLRTGLGAAALTLPVMGLAGFDVYRRQVDSFTSYDIALLVAFWTALPIAAFGIGRVIFLLRQRVELQQRLHAAELSTVIRDERLRLARDLHDVVAHSVSAMILQAAGARSLDDRTDERIKEALRSVETTGADAMRELHRLLGLLRAPSDEPPPLTAQPGIGDLDQVIETTRACGVGVMVDESGERRPLDPEVSYTAFRMVQECMANVIKHGGAGAECTLRIAWHEDGVDITVRSDEHEAVNATMLSGGYGLRGLTERVQQVGGRFDAGPEAESIFVASMSLPFRPRAAVAGG